MDELIRGMMHFKASEVDNQITSEVRNRLFANNEGREQLDLAALNIQRGRDHGVPMCNDLREVLGLPRCKTFDEMAMNSDVAKKLENA